MQQAGGFLWSPTRERTLRECARRYFFRYHPASLADPVGGATRPRVLALRRLTTLDQALGVQVHRRARELVLAVVSGREVPSAEEIRTRTRNSLQPLWNNLDRGRFRRDLRSVPMLVGRYYGRETTAAEIERLRMKMAACHAHLAGNALWARIGQLSRRDVLCLDSIRHATLGGTRACLAPDLIYREPGGCGLLDWKTGRDPQARYQLHVYALYARDHLRIPFRAGSFHGRVVNLRSGREDHSAVTQQELDEAAEAIRASAALMTALHQAAETSGDPRSVFPLTDCRSRCRECPFWELCAVELGHSSEAEPA